MIKNCNLLLPPLRASKLQEKPEKPSALKREQPVPVLQKIKFFNFFLFLGVIFALPDPDSTTWGARNRVGIRLSWPARLHMLRNRFLGSLKVLKIPSQICFKKASVVCSCTHVCIRVNYGFGSLGFSYASV
jgi:hypothetical protein